MEIVRAGTASTQNVGYKRPVTIYSSGNTELTGRKRLYVDAEGVTAGTAEAECDTRSRIHNIVAKLRLIRRIAWKKAGEQKGQAEQIASRRAEQQVAERMNQQAAEMLAEVNEGLSNNIRGPLIRLGAFPKEVKMSTTSDYFFTRILQADTAQIAAPTAPPEINEHCDLAIRMHHSSANNFAESLLAGRTLPDEQLAESAKKLTGEVPKELEITSETEPWSITFPAAEPLRVEFGEQWVKIAIRGRQFTRSESVLTKPVDIRAEYKVETSEAGVRLVRQGDVELDFVGRTRLSVGDVAFKTFLLKKFDSLFKPELKFSDVALPGRWERAGSLQVSTFQTAAGWLSTDWNLVPRDKLADAADPAAGPAATSAKPAVEPQPTR